MTGEDWVNGSEMIGIVIIYMYGMGIQLMVGMGNGNAEFSSNEGIEPADQINYSRWLGESKCFHGLLIDRINIGRRLAPLLVQ